jgi:hypothetical protein
MRVSLIAMCEQWDYNLLGTLDMLQVRNWAFVGSTDS